jgi:hypothetical protein
MPRIIGRARSNTSSKTSDTMRSTCVAASLSTRELSR